jgi:hypothetical protein
MPEDSESLGPSVRNIRPRWHTGALVTGPPFQLVICWFVGIGLSTMDADHNRPRAEPAEGSISNREMIFISLSARLASSVILLLYRMDIIVLGLYVSRAELWLYSVAVPLA